jgi:polysaccharide biosynthesis protein PelG
MAGIGFALQKLREQETISAVASSSLHAAVIAAGPWLFTVLSLITITAAAEPVAGHNVLASFRALVIYAFSISLVLAAPVTIVATRIVADDLWAHQTSNVRALFFCASALSALLVAVGVAALAAALPVPGPFAIALYVATAIVAMLWVALAFAGAIKDYKGITGAFAAGLVVATVLSCAAALMGFDAAGMAYGFTTGLAVTLFGLILRICAAFPGETALLGAELHRLILGFRTYGYLAVGAFFGAAGVWADKWVFWLSPEQQTVQGGLIHAPLYDSAMFIASLVMIPSLAQFVMSLETDFFDRYQKYYGTIRDHGTFEQIEDARVKLADVSLEKLALITAAHLALAVVLILAAPAIVDVLNLQFRQIAILRFGSFGSVFQFIFIAAASIVIFFDRRRMYCGLQFVFFLLSFALSALTVHLGEDFYGVGYFVAAVVASLVALIVAEHTFHTLNYLTFIGNNPSIRGHSRGFVAEVAWWLQSRLRRRAAGRTAR